MKKIIFVFSMLLIGTNAYSQTVDRGELQSGSINDIEFESYLGKSAIDNTAEQIRLIGVDLARESVIAGKTEYTYANKYGVKLVLNPEEDGLAAAIITLESGAAVDHIRNLRTIIQGFLQEAFGYSAQDAAVLARYTTLYNATYRKDIAHFESVYKDSVIKALDPNKVGLATTYKEWPGKTQIVIPLSSSAKAGEKMSVRADEFMNEDVNKKIREESNGKASEELGERGDLVDLASNLHEQRQEKIDGLEGEIKEIKDEISELDSKISQAQKDLEAGGVGTFKGENKEGLTPEEIAKLAYEKELAEKAAKEKADQLAAKQQELKLEENNFVEEETKLQTTREELKKDIQNALGLNDSIYFTRTANDGIEIFMIDSVTGMKDTSMPSVKNIASREILENKDSLIALQGTQKEADLILINKENLEVTTRSETKLYGNSPLIIKDGFIYGVASDNGNWVIKKFDMNLKEVAKGSKPVNPDGSLRAVGSSIYAEGADGKTIVLNKDNLQ